MNLYSSGTPFSYIFLGGKGRSDDGAHISYIYIYLPIMSIVYTEYMYILYIYRYIIIDIYIYRSCFMHWLHFARSAHNS